jgi:hypothetical protein
MDPMPSAYHLVLYPPLNQETKYFNKLLGSEMDSHFLIPNFSTLNTAVIFVQQVSLARGEDTLIPMTVAAVNVLMDLVECIVTKYSRVTLTVPLLSTVPSR